MKWMIRKTGLSLPAAERCSPIHGPMWLGTGRGTRAGWMFYNDAICQKTAGYDGQLLFPFICHAWRANKKGIAGAIPSFVYYLFLYHSMSVFDLKSRIRVCYHISLYLIIILIIAMIPIIIIMSTTARAVPIIMPTS